MTEILLAQLINGVALGSIYALLVTCFNLLFRFARIIHFSFPVVLVCSIYVIWGVVGISGTPIYLALLAGFLAAVVLNVATTPLFLLVQRRVGGDINTTLIISMGLGMILTEFLSHRVNRGFPISLQGLEQWRRIAIPLPSRIAVLSLVDALSLGVSILMVVGLFFFLHNTQTGRAFRAVAENPEKARLLGISVTGISLLGQLIAGVVGGVTAVLLALQLGAASPSMGDQLGHKVLAVAIIAGIGNLRGGMLTGLILGVVEAVVQGYWSSSWSNAIVFTCMLLALLLRTRRRR